MLKGIHHVQIAVSRETEASTIEFYKNILGLKEIPKPEALRKNGGVWFEVGLQQFHIAAEDVPFEYNGKSKRHLCFLVEDLAATMAYFKEKGVEVIPDNQPISNWQRFYFRDPAGNRMECAEMTYENN